MFDTVAAISTPRGVGGIALIRLSGPEAAAIADRVFFPKGEKLSARPPRTAVYGSFCGSDGLIDKGVAVLYKAPASFTGEDTVEFSFHGGAAVQKAMLAAVLAAGASPAGPGDFTRRAFVNGKLTLSEAEAVGLMIEADTESRRTLAAAALRGALTDKTAPIAQSLLGVLSALYAAIDYPEEDVGDEGEREIARVLADAIADTRALADTYRAGAAVVRGVPTVLVGLPNSGKSSLYNALLGEDAAIVTDIPGTTRDALTAHADVGGVTLTLTDTAGIRKSEDAVEKLGVERSLQALDRAALVFLLLDASVPFSEAARALFARIPRRDGTVLVFTKADLPAALTEAERSSLSDGFAATVSLSVHSGAGLSDLAAAVARLTGRDRVDLAADGVLWDARQKAAVDAALAALTEARDALAAHAPTDAVCALTEAAVSHLSALDGRAVDEAIIEGIFARFCVGK